MRPLGVALMAGALFTVGGVMPASGAGEGGRVTFHSVPTRWIDTRNEQQPVTSLGLGSGVLTVSIQEVGGVGEAWLYSCSDVPSANQPTFRLGEGHDRVQYARLASSDPVCLTSTVPVHVILDRSGEVAPVPQPSASQYVPLPTPVTLLDDPTSEESVQIDLGRPAELAVGAAAVLSLEALVPEAPGFVTAFGCGHPLPLSADLGYARNRAANVAYVQLDDAESICVFVYRPTHLKVKLLGSLSDSGPNPAALPPSWRYTASEVPPPSLRPITPARVLDTRIGLGHPGTSKLAANDVLELELGNLVGPLTSAVVLNVTVTEPDGPGFVTVWPCGGDRPVVSNLNFDRNETVPNLVVSSLGPGRTVCVSGMTSTHLVADVSGTYEADGGLQAVPITPERVLDTRSGLGVPSPGKLPSGEVLELQIGGRAGVPDDAGAATVNVTVTEPEDSGYVTAFPCDEDRPTASNLNFTNHQTVPNLVTAKLSSDGKLCLFTQTTTHLVADVAAWYGVDRPAGLIDLAPARILDTRVPIGVPQAGKVAAGQFVRLQVAGRGGVADDADAVVMNVTVTEPGGNGFVTVWPCDTSMPTVSNLNYTAGDTRPNLATVKLATDGTVCLYTMAAAHLIADVSGYLTDEPVDGLALALE